MLLICRFYLIHLKNSSTRSFVDRSELIHFVGHIVLVSRDKVSVLLPEVLVKHRGFPLQSHHKDRSEDCFSFVHGLWMAS